MKNSDDPLVVLSTKVPESLKKQLETFAASVNLSQSKIVSEALTQFLDADAHSLDSVRTMQSDIAQLKQQLRRLQAMMSA
jgi:predicted transcriptional regulator